MGATWFLLSCTSSAAGDCSRWSLSSILRQGSVPIRRRRVVLTGPGCLRTGHARWGWGVYVAAGLLPAECGIGDRCVATALCRVMLGRACLWMLEGCWISRMFGCASRTQAGGIWDVRSGFWHCCRVAVALHGRSQLRLQPHCRSPHGGTCIWIRGCGCDGEISARVRYFCCLLASSRAVVPARPRLSL